MKIAGMPMMFWIETFIACHEIEKIDRRTNVRRIEWPDGRAYWEQDNILVIVFLILAQEFRNG